MVTKKSKKTVAESAVETAAATIARETPKTKTASAKPPKKNAHADENGTAKKSSVTAKSKKEAATAVSAFQPFAAPRKAPDHEAIAKRAWEIWQGEGCPEGREVEHWLRAERELQS